MATLEQIGIKLATSVCSWGTVYEDTKICTKNVLKKYQNLVKFGANLTV